MGKAENSRLWKPEEKEQLTEIWQRTGSIAIAAKYVGKSIPSTLSMAHRLRLPYRPGGTQRRHWVAEELNRLNELLNEYTNKHNQIHIVIIARQMNRSIDAITGRLLKIFENERALLDRYTIDEGEMELYVKEKSLLSQGNRPVRKTRLRPCMNCERVFPSEGPHNRLCLVCRKLG
ncbi:hypothetical protein ACQU0X_27140 [Pseudovibrio ascidiaceicola]|uniref:hypothetical protein n=1 Tax=Pseudovibrio ascidiaceicola TaxID=285279 RepID=UPI003D36C0BA